MTLSHDTLTDYAYGVFMTDGIYIPNPTFTVSSQEQGGKVSHTFRIYNLRPQRLSVQAHPDCGCTGVSWENATIAPFGWKDISAGMEIKGVATGKSVSIAFRTDKRDKPFLFAFMRT